jgi:hypothetical protein
MGWAEAKAIIVGSRGPTTRSSHAYTRFRCLSRLIARMFFFEKKNQKTFASYGPLCSEVRDSQQKFFASFFQKRRPFCP